MPRPARNTPEKPLPPTTSQIVKLHGLVNETREMAQEVNTPLNSLIFASIYSLRPEKKIINISVAILAICLNKMFSIPGEEVFAGHKLPRSAIISYILLFPMIYLTWYKVWQLSRSLLLKQFPNGIDFDKEDRTFRALQKKFHSREELDSLMIELQKFIARQYTHKNVAIIFSLILCIALGTPFYINRSVNLNADVLGFYISPSINLNSKNITFFEAFLLGMISAIQRPLVYSPLYSLWSNFDVSGKLENYRKHLNSLTDFDLEWKLLSVSKTEKISKHNAIFELDISEDTVKNNLIKLSASQFIIEFHRVLMKKNIPAFISDNKLSVAYSGMYYYFGYSRICGINLSDYCILNNRTSKQIKKALQKNLESASHFENQTDDVIEKLYGIFPLFKKNKIMEWLNWDAYRAPDDKGHPEEYYFSSLISLPPVYREPYLASLSKIAKNVTIDGDIVTLSHVSDDPADYNAAKNLLKEKIALIQQASDNQHMMTQAPDSKIKQKKPKLNQPESDEEKLKTTNKLSTIYPTSIQFSDGVTFSSEQIEQKHFDTYQEDVTRAWPLHVSWIPEGRAYISIDPDVIAEVSPYLTTARIMSRLQTGTVHGTHKSDKTKVGAVGIQSTNEAYTTIHGKKVTAATFKAQDDNFRLFARCVEKNVIGSDGKPHDHYRIDGFGLGHT